MPGKKKGSQERLKIEGDWEAAVGKALKKAPPADGWEEEKPKRPAKKRRKKKTEEPKV